MKLLFSNRIQKFYEIRESAVLPLLQLLRWCRKEIIVTWVWKGTCATFFKQDKSYWKWKQMFYYLSVWYLMSLARWYFREIHITFFYYLEQRRSRCRVLFHYTKWRWFHYLKKNTFTYTKMERNIKDFFVVLSNMIQKFCSYIYKRSKYITCL